MTTLSLANQLIDQTIVLKGRVPAHPSNESDQLHGVWVLLAHPIPLCSLYHLLCQDDVQVFGRLRERGSAMRILALMTPEISLSACYITPGHLITQGASYDLTRSVKLGMINSGSKLMNWQKS